MISVGSERVDRGYFVKNVVFEYFIIGRDEYRNTPAGYSRTGAVHRDSIRSEYMYLFEDAEYPLVKPIGNFILTYKIV